MENFPQLKSSQVALVRADFNTGDVLDENFVLVQEASQKVHTIFNSIEEAVNYAKSKIPEKQSIECVIQGPDQQLIHYITPKNIKNF